MRVFETLAELAALQGQEVGVSDEVTVTQAMIDDFARATGDHQWIHVDPARAAQGPFGTTIAHGFLTLSLIPAFFDSALKVRQSRMGVNCWMSASSARKPSSIEPAGSSRAVARS